MSLNYTRKGENMENKLMFKGFETEEEWKNTLEEQNNHLRDEYNVDLNFGAIDVDEMNLMAIKAKNFTDKRVGF
jgi:hypothetical protein